MSSRVINTILSLRDEMSLPLKNIAKTTLKAKEALENAKKQIDKAKEATIKNSEALKKAKEVTSDLRKVKSQYRTEIQSVEARLSELTSKTNLNRKESIANNEAIKAAKQHLENLKKSQNVANESLKKAQEQVKRHQEALNESNKVVDEAKQKARNLSAEVIRSNKAIKEAQSTVRNWGNSVMASVDKVLVNIAKVGAAFAGTAFVGGGTVGFMEAMDWEGYKAQLETATQSTEAAGKAMAAAVKLANDTPFETGQVIESTATMEAYGLSSSRWLKDVANMAGATNKDILQATEAMADASMGEFERLKEFGILKEDLIARAAEKYGKDIVFNKKGQVKDELLLQDTLQALMQEKFKDGAKKQAATMRGMWSTIVGMTKSSLANILGMTNQGTIRQGSLYANLKEQMQKVIDKLNEWAKSGIIEKIGDSVAKTIGNMISFFSSLYNFINKYQSLIEIVLVFASSIYIAIKALAALKAIMGVINIVIGIFNGTLALTPFGWIVIAIGAVLTALYFLWKHFDTVLAGIKIFFSWIAQAVDFFAPFLYAIGLMTGPIGWLIAALTAIIQHFDKIKEVGSKAFGWIKGVFGIGDNPEGEEKKPSPKPKPKNIDVPPDPTNSRYGMPELKTPVINTQGNVTNSTKISNKKQKTSQTINKYEVKIMGDVYGMKDFNEKVAQAIVETNKVHGANIV